MVLLWTTDGTYVQNTSTDFIVSLIYDPLTMIVFLLNNVFYLLQNKCLDTHDLLWTVSLGKLLTRTHREQDLPFYPLISTLSKYRKILSRNERKTTIVLRGLVLEYEYKFWKKKEILGSITCLNGTKCILVHTFIQRKCT